MRESELRLVVHHPGQAEVSQLAVVVRVQEDIAWLQIPVQDLLRKVTFVLVLRDALRIVFDDPIVDFSGFRPPVAVEQG